jgi:hypothetical protein
MSRMIIACLAVSLVACDPPPPPARPRLSSFGCSGAPDVPVAKDPVPTGNVEVRVLGDGPDGPRMRVLAENASASELAIRIGEVLGATTRIDPELDRISISLYVPDVSVDLLGALLRTSHVRLSKRDWQKDRMLQFSVALANQGESSPVESQILPASRVLTADQMASLFCRTASPAGWAQVVGDRVMVADRTIFLARFSSILERIDERIEPPARTRH